MPAVQLRSAGQDRFEKEFSFLDQKVDILYSQGSELLIGSFNVKQ